MTDPESSTAATLFELSNSLFIVFVITDFVNRRSTDSTLAVLAYNYGVYYMLPWLLSNILFYHSQIIRSAVVRLAVIISYPTLAVGELIGSSAIVIVIVSVIYVAWTVLLRGISDWRCNFYHHMFRIACIAIGFVLLKLLGFDDTVSHSEALKVTVIAMSFMLLLYIDVRRHKRYVSFSSLLTALYHAVMYSLFAIPVLAVLISFFLLIIVSILEKVGADPEHSAFVNNVVFYGTLYGPFYILYWHTKKSLLSVPILPW